MKKYIEILKNTKIFLGISGEEIEAMLTCLDARQKAYKKGEYVFRQGDGVLRLALLVEGSLLVQNDDYWGNRTIVNKISVGETFGESFLAPNSGSITNDVVASQDCVVMFFDINNMMSVCSSACVFHSKVVQNLFFSISEKNRKLVAKLEHVTRRTTREKLISYLSQEVKRQNSNTVTIPFNRQQLADFLSVDRSAMSNELCKMRDEGMLKFKKNKFELL